MTNLSWLIYAADIVDKMNRACGLALAFFIVAFIAANFCLVISNSNYIETVDFKNINLILVKTFKWFVPLMVVLLVIVPTQNTMYLIAASELMQKSQTVEKIETLVDPTIDLLRKKILDNLQEINKPK